VLKQGFRSREYEGKPSVAPMAVLAISSPLPLKAELVMLTNVVPSGRGVKTHSMSVGVPYAGHSTRILLLVSSAFTFASTEKPYISQSQRTVLPASSLPLPRLNQNFEVTAGSVKASNTSRHRDVKSLS
jgi:hypothetical protein